MSRPSRVALGVRTVFLGWCGVGEASPASLSPAEAVVAQRLTLDKRRTEFCAGRVAARRALLAAGVGEPFDVLAREVGVDAGRPFASVHGQEVVGRQLSISHAVGWAVAAAVVGAPVGIDLEGLDLPADEAFDGEAFAEGELAAWALPPALAQRRRSIAWAAKEAVLKAWGLGLRAPLGQVSLRPSLVHPRPDGWSLRLQVECFDGDAVLRSQPRALHGALVTLDDAVLLLAQADEP